MQSSWMLVAGALFAVMGVCVKLGAQRFSVLELVFYRSLFGLLFIAAVIIWRRGTFATPHLRMHLSRSLSGLVSLGFYFYAMTQLPVATAVTLNYTSSMFLALIGLLWFRERHSRRLVFAVVLGFVGVVLLLRPTIDQSQLPAGLLGLTSGFLAAIAYLNIRRLSRAKEPDWRVVFYFCLVCTVLTGVILCFGEFHAIDARSAVILLGIGASATLAQLALTRAHRLGNTLVVGSFAYSTIVFAALLGFVLLGERLPLSGWAGMAIVIAAGLLAVRKSEAARD